MSVKFVFSSVPMTTVVAPDSTTRPSGPVDHDHHYQVVLEEDALRKLVEESDGLRHIFTQAAYTALRDGEHKMASIYVSVFGVKIGKAHNTFFNDVSNHKAVQGVVDEAMQMASELVK